MKQLLARLNVADSTIGLAAVTGVPFKRGVFFPNDYIEARATDTNEEVKIWWEARAFWSDGSVKWIFLHMLPVFKNGQVELFKTNQKSAINIERNFDCRIVNGKVIVKAALQQWIITKDFTIIDNQNIEQSSTKLKLIEDSPICSLYRVSSNENDIKTEYLIRVSNGGFSLMRRVTVMKNTTLKHSSICIKTKDRFPITNVSKLTYENISELEKDIYIEGENTYLSILDGNCLYPISALVKLENENSKIQLDLYTNCAEPYKVFEGTSFRHEIECFDKQSTRAVVTFDYAYLANTKVFGPLYVPETDTDRLTFPGLVFAAKQMLDKGKWNHISKDSAYFGLLNYGDWPLNVNQYGANGYRGYADNEYDAPYAYMCAYSVYNDKEYLEISKRCARHMADVDINEITGDMRYHGYSEEAENHVKNRVCHGDLGHYWVDGLFANYYMFGDVWLKERAEALVKYVVSLFEKEKTFYKEWAICERHLGWALLNATSAYEACQEEEFKKFAFDIVDFIYKFSKSPDDVYNNPEESVTWWRVAMQDGCKPFMLGVLMEALERHYDVFGYEPAKNSLVYIAQYICDVTFDKLKADFTYEVNAYGRGHRDINAQQLTPLFVRGIMKSYHYTKNRKFFDIGLYGFHSSLWTLYDESNGGKEIALIFRNLFAFAGLAIEAYEEELEALTISHGDSFAIKNVIENEITIENAYTENGYIKLQFIFNNQSTDYLNQRGLLHLCGKYHNGVAVSVITFYRNLSVRFYNSKRKLIASLDMDLDKNKVIENQQYQLEIIWQKGIATLLLDGVLADTVPLDRMSSAFTCAMVGKKPGGWIAKGTVQLLELNLSKETEDQA